VSKFKQNDRENIIHESVFIYFKHKEKLHFKISLTSICMGYLNKYLFLACFVYLILSQKILDLTRNIKNLIFV
jgi:hypothetical protein